MRVDQPEGAELHFERTHYNDSCFMRHHRRTAHRCLSEEYPDCRR